MTDERDERDDADPQLRSLRQVWLSMPDEDPPMRGLDALMAAATAKAREMAPPATESFWHRLLATLRRPPVLALATVMVLIGGAVLISQRDSVKDGAQPSVEQQRAKESVAPAATPPVAAPPAKPGVVEDKQPEETDTVEHRDVTVRPAHESPHGNVKHQAPPKVLGGQKAPTKVPGFVPPQVESGRASSDSAEETLDEMNRQEPAKDPTDAKADVKAAGEAEGTRGPRRVMVDELLTESRNAATRGDCESSRLIAQRIEKQDLAFYRSRVETDTAIKKCIAPAATNAGQ